MTIIRPNKNKSYWNFILFFLGSAVFACVILITLFYSLTVSIRHEAQQLEVKIENLRLANAELRNELFSLTSFDHLQKIAAEKGLIKDKNPQWAFVSQ